MRNFPEAPHPVKSELVGVAIMLAAVAFADKAGCISLQKIEQSRKSAMENAEKLEPRLDYTAIDEVTQDMSIKIEENNLITEE